MRTRVLCCICFSLFLLFANYALAQDGHDWCSWTGVALNYRISPDLRIMSKAQVRTKDDFSKFERFFINSGVGYKVLPRLELRAVVAYHRRSSSKGEFNAYRYHLGSEASWKRGGFRFQWRERFQHTFALNDDEMMIRSRLKFDYTVPATIFTPYFSVETFNDIESDDFFDANRIRYIPGLKMKLTDMYFMSVFYCRQDDGTKKSNIAGVEFFINL